MATNKVPHTATVADRARGLRKLQAYVLPDTAKAIKAAAALQGCNVGQVIDQLAADKIAKFIDVEGLTNDPAMTGGPRAA